MTDWAILRTKGSSTLRLARSLAADGFKAWTPVEVRSRLVGRKRERAELELPILPEFVFVPSDHTAELLTLSRSPSLLYRVWDSAQRRLVDHGHPHFSMFAINGQIRQVNDRGLAPLRALEETLDQDAQRRREQERCLGPIPRFHKGDEVRVDGGGFEGLTLRVVAPNVGKMVQLTHPAWMWVVEISAFKLRDIQLSQALPEQGAAIAA